jgi:hypothetical protein
MTKHMTVQLQPGKDKNISQELAILAWSGAVNIAPGTYTVDNALLMAAADDREDA